MPYMERTTIMLPKELRKAAASFARQRNISLAELIRLSLSDVLKRKQKDFNTDGGLYGLMLDAIEDDGVRDLAENHDKYLYNGIE